MSTRRRQFLKSSALAAASLGLGSWPALAAEADDPDRGPELIVLNGTVYTIDDAKPKAEAFAVRNGRFIAVGNSADVRKLATKHTRILDAAGMTVLPGFIDAHTHPAASGAEHLMYVDCNQPAIADIQKAITQRAAKTAEGEWVFGFKYDDTKLSDNRPLSRADLDAASPKHPVRVTHRGGHTAVYNSLGFKLAGITKDTPDPEGGKFGRDAKGELTGFAAEKAVDRVKKLPIPTREQGRDGARVISELMTAAGLTSVHDADADRSNFLAYQDARAAGELRFRAYVMANPDLFETWKAASLRTGFGDDVIRLGGLKLYCDGSASERTMRMSKPYIGRPNDYGILVTTQDKLNDQVRDAHSNHFQVGVHCNGDVAIDMVLTAYELMLRAIPRADSRPRLEHCTLVNPALLKRIAALGAIPTPFYTYVHYHGDKWGQYGDERVQWMFAHRSFLDHKIKVAGASDYVPGPYEPLMAIQSMVTRKDVKGRVWGGNQKISVDEALKVCTIHGAHASFEEKTKGTITPGKLADFVMLAADPHTVEADKIKEIKVVRTVVGGKTVHPKEGD
ncbi:MAG: amidohydrolase [Gemmataceae bacterium]|nr:amidohydrolase [Gemmataceae bacterium]